MTVRFCYDSRDEDSENEDPEVISPGREFIEDIECRLQQDIVSTVLQQSKLLFKSVIPGIPFMIYLLYLKRG